jgi:hypothetical protein
LRHRVPQARRQKPRKITRLPAAATLRASRARRSGGRDRVRLRRGIVHSYANCDPVPMTLPRRVHLHRDTCNVYLLVDGGEAIAIDFGSGSVLEHLSEYGVTRITDVVMTHHHRDQGQG